MFSAILLGIAATANNKYKSIVIFERFISDIIYTVRNDYAL